MQKGRELSLRLGELPVLEAQLSAALEAGTVLEPQVLLLSRGSGQEPQLRPHPHWGSPFLPCCCAAEGPSKL